MGMLNLANEIISTRLPPLLIKAKRERVGELFCLSSLLKSSGTKNYFLLFSVHILKNTTIHRTNCLMVEINFIAKFVAPKCC